MNAQTKKGSLFLRLLLNKFLGGKADLLSKLLPKEEVDNLNSVQSSSSEPELILFDSKTWLTICDPSWYESITKNLPEQLQGLYKELLHNKTERLSPDVTQFLLDYFHKEWLKNLNDDEPLPKELIEAGDLGPLLELKKAEMLEVIDLLSMHNLVDEVRHVVDKRILHVLSQALSSNQQQYLRMCLRQKTKHHAPTFSLRDLLKEPKKLPQVLHKQGLKRMAVALSGQSKDFIWYVVHTLDIARAKFLQADIQEEAVAHATKLAQLEILQIIQFLKTDKS